MRYVFPTRSRTGSQFVLKLAFSLQINKTNENYAGITGSRQNTNEDTNEFHNYFIRNKGIDYIKKKKIEIMKFEDPGNGSTFIYDIVRHFPNCLFIASHRKLEKVINSHYNIKKWGHSWEKVLEQFKLSLYLYEKLHSMNKLFLIDVDNPDIFSLDRFINFMGLQKTKESVILAKNWKPINDLKYQKDKHDGGYNEEDIKKHPICKNIRESYPWINDFELRYQKIIDDINKGIK